MTRFCFFVIIKYPILGYFDKSLQKTAGKRSPLQGKAQRCTDGRTANKTAADFKYRNKRPVILTFVKRFYENSAETVAEEALTENDILFLLTLFDSTLNYHINFGSETEAEYNAEFETQYRVLRDAFFDCFSGIDEADYAVYTAKGENGRLCAGMQWLPTEKQRFLTDKYEGLTKEYKFLSQP